MVSSAFYPAAVQLHDTKGKLRAKIFIDTTGVCKLNCTAGVKSKGSKPTPDSSTLDPVPPIPPLPVPD